MKLSQPVLINFGILLALQIAAVGWAIWDGADPGLMFILLSSFAIIIQSGINFTVSIVLAIAQKSEPAKNFVLAALMVILVGFGLCLAGVGLVSLK
ncbi:MAG: hypothetical protein MUC97_04465 [Bernardetiaceae bacterium]|jgi:hypothetical protein|nr:hypothetical protein [Bernardetiaceae bacterium]